MPLTHAWNKGTQGKGGSALTGIFPGAQVTNVKISDSTTYYAAGTNTTVDQQCDAGESGVFIPFSDLTGLNVEGAKPEIRNLAALRTAGDATVLAGGSRFMLAVLEASYAAQQSAASTDRLASCVVTRSALSVVDADTLQKTFTVKFKLNHTSQEIEAE